MSRMIPSPDWFIGIDSFDLCVNGNWLDSITIEVSIILSCRASIINLVYQNIKHNIFLVLKNTHVQITNNIEFVV